MKDKIRTTSFWLGFSGVIVLIFECVASLCGIDIASEVVESIIISIKFFTLIAPYIAIYCLSLKSFHIS